MTTARSISEALAARAVQPNPAAIADAFRLALGCAEAFVGATAPNPPVGCAVLDATGQTLACGAHARAGQAHAEVAALDACRRAGTFGRIHTVVVTLEPCNHTGRTPPCVDAILASPARMVWFGVRDPNAEVLGGGAGRLSAAGLGVGVLEDLPHPEAADLAQMARRLVAPFRQWKQIGRPWLTVKQALDANGSMVPPPGRTTFTSQASLTLAHRLRRRADAIVTGAGCVLADDPAFTVRHVPDHFGKRRTLAILDRRGRVPTSYVTAAEERGFKVLIRGDLMDLLRELGAAGVMEALVEAGPTLLGAILEAGLWDERVVIRQNAVLERPDTVDVRTRVAV
jgi:diaminohydroxyphosphoribosylaminopyrimidine deaminase/5-amino-6-(5-phosphoribosylamino)uracil reductase